MKKAILYTLVGLTAVATVYNTYNVVTNNNKVINKTIKEEYDSSEIDIKISDLSEENKKLKEEIDALKEENNTLNEKISSLSGTVDSNKRSISELSKKTVKNYDSEINNLNDANALLKENYYSLVDCLFWIGLSNNESTDGESTNVLFATNLKSNYNGGQIYIGTLAKCQKMIDNYKNK